MLFIGMCLRPVSRSRERIPAEVCVLMTPLLASFPPVYMAGYAQGGLIVLHQQSRPPVPPLDGEEYERLCCQMATAPDSRRLYV
jgi:hypothetical protein